MARPNKNKTVKRDHIVTIRFTPEEDELVRSKMAAFDYHSKSEFIRTLLLHKYIPVQKVKITDKSLRRQIDIITSMISRVGANYNQVVKRYSQSCKQTKRDGTPVINVIATQLMFDKLFEITKEVRDFQKIIIEQVKHAHIYTDDPITEQFEDK